jgi:hypothetical protein
MDKDKELNDMMAAIKNIKNKDENNFNIHKEEVNGKDTSFYTRIFHNNGDTVASNNINNNSSNDLQKQLDDYFESVAFNVKLDEMVKQSLLQSVQNQIYMNKLIGEVLKEYTNLHEDMRNNINILIKDEVMKLMKTCSKNLSETLKNI